MLLNIHTHHPLHEGEQTIPSFGLHPWQVGDDWEQQIAALSFPPSTDKWIVGECGLDRLHPDTYPQQLKAFDAQIDISEKLGKPMVIHCVKAWDDLLRMHRRATQPWVIHGFRGNPQQLAQLLSHGLLVSFGFKYNKQSVAACPSDRMFLETDDCDKPIAPLYAEVAAIRGTDVEDLRQGIWQNMAENLTRAF